MLPPSAKLASWAVRYGPALLPLAQKLYDQGKFRQLAILHARTIVDGTFSWEMVDGDRVWVVWTDDEIVATYPDVRGGTEDVRSMARPERRQDPDDVAVRRITRAVRARLPRPTGGTRPDDPWDRTPDDPDED